jgi:peptidoglycan/xylan/chitin deacetylase (PgdA/CDA1 family)
VGNRRSSDAGDGKGTTMGAAGRLVISFDFELFWGVRDSTTLERYGPNILGVREAIPRLLETFEKHGIHATWGTVGFLFFDDKDELLAHLPEVRPDYADRRLSPFEAIRDIGPDEKRDPYHFGLSLLRQIQACPGQEIGTHTFSHYYCLEAGQDEVAFRADLWAARRAAARIGVRLRSITFPRHQINDGYLGICRELGLIAYRGQPRSWMHDPYERRMPLRRALRLADSYLAISGHNGGRARRGPGGMIDVPASRFLRPFTPRLAALESLRLRRLTAEMRRAACDGAIYHLWWHPHNFGRNLDENFAVLDRLVATFRELALEHGMQASTMAEVAELALAVPEGAGAAALGGTVRRGDPRAAAAEPGRAGA